MKILTKNYHLLRTGGGEAVQMLESQQLYYVGCKNDNLPCVDDQLTEVPALQRGVEVRWLILLVVLMLI